MVDYSRGGWAGTTTRGLGFATANEGQMMATRLTGSGDGRIASGDEWEGLDFSTGMDIMPA